MAPGTAGLKAPALTSGRALLWLPSKSAQCWSREGTDHPGTRGRWRWLGSTTITHQGHHQMWRSCEQEGWARWPPAAPPNLSHLDQPSDAQPPAPTCSRDNLWETLGSSKICFFRTPTNTSPHPTSPPARTGAVWSPPPGGKPLLQNLAGTAAPQRLTFWHGDQEVEHLLRQVRPNGQDLLLKLGV